MSETFVIQNKDEEIRSYLRELTRMRTAQLHTELPSALGKPDENYSKGKHLSDYYRSERRSVRRDNETDASSPRPFTGEEEARPRHLTGRTDRTLLTSLETAQTTRNIVRLRTPAANRTGNKLRNLSYFKVQDIMLNATTTLT